MAATQETVPALHVVKGRRTKRQRLLPPSSAPATSSSSSVEIEISARSAEEEEDEDLANCLILLAQGNSVNRLSVLSPPDSDSRAIAADETEQLGNRGVAANGKVAAGGGGGGGGLYVYECKTCNKCFSSFQALGGHRTSHKKSKQTLSSPAIDGDSIQLSMNSFSGASIVGKIARVHECSICGSEFASGQALGGHMRRHRPANLSEPVEAKKERNNILFSLDLNLPAPAEDYSCSRSDLPASPSAAAAGSGTGGFAFGSKAPLLLPRSALVDCQF